MSRRFVVVLAVAALALLPGAAGAAEAQLLSVPYRSQLDGNPYQGADCGPTSLAMAMAAHGVVVPTRELRAQVNDLQGTWGVYDAGAAIANLALIAGRYGLIADGLKEGRGLHRWTLGELRDRLDAGQPVVAQVR